MRATPLLLALSVAIAGIRGCTPLVYAAAQAPGISLDSYRCDQFLADAGHPDDATKLLRTLMVVSWAAGFAAAHEKSPERSDKQSLQLVAAAVAAICREHKNETVAAAFVASVKNVLNNRPPASASSPSTIEKADAVSIIRAFYEALSQGDGVRASALVIPEKRGGGPFSSAELTRFYGSLPERLHLSDVKPSGSNAGSAEYTYTLPGGQRCAGKSLVYVTSRGSEMLIERIKTLSGC